MMSGMSVIFFGVVIWNVIFLGVTLATAYWGVDPGRWWHFSAGVFTAIFTMFTHCLVLIHMAGSSKGIKEAIGAYGLADDPETGFQRRIRRNRAKISPYAYLGSLLIMTVVFLGGWHHSKLIWHESHNFNLSFEWHRWAAWFAVVFNLYGFWKEYQVVRSNREMNREMNSLLEEKGLVEHTDPSLRP